MNLLRDWWRVDPGGVVLLVGFTLAAFLGGISAALFARA